MILDGASIFFAFSQSVLRKSFSYLSIRNDTLNSFQSDIKSMGNPKDFKSWYAGLSMVTGTVCVRMASTIFGDWTPLPGGQILYLY